MVVALVTVSGAACGVATPQDIAVAYLSLTPADPTESNVDELLALFADDATYSSFSDQASERVGKSAIRQRLTSSDGPHQFYIEHVGSPTITANSITIESLSYPLELYRAGVPLDPTRAGHIVVTLTVVHGKIVRDEVQCVLNC